MTKQNAIKLTFAVVALTAVAAYRLVPWQRLSLAWQRAAHERQMEELAAAREMELAVRPIHPNTAYDVRVEGFGQMLEAPNGVEYQLFDDGTISWSPGDGKPNVQFIPPTDEYLAAKLQMYRQLSEVYQPDKHGPLLDYRHEDERGNAWFEFPDGTRIDVVKGS